MFLQPAPFCADRRAQTATAILRACCCAFALLITCGNAWGQQEPASAVGPMMKLFKSGRLPAERQGTVVEMICNRGNESDLRVILDRLLSKDGFPAELRRKSIDWLIDAAATRKVKPTGSLDAIKELMSEQDTALQVGAVRLASVWKLESFAPVFRQIATQSEGLKILQQAAIEGLVALGGDENLKALVELSNTPQPMAVRILAVSGLTQLDLTLASQQAAKAFVDATPEDQPQFLLNAFFDRQGGSDRLAEALQKVKLSIDIAKMALRYMYSIGRSDANLSNTLSEAAGIAADPPPPTQEEVAKMVEEVLAKGDAARGEEIFRRNELSCFRCHGISRAGGQVGPDLSAVGVSSPVDYIVNSILNPNLAVKELFVTRVYLLEGGRTVTGVVIDQNDDRVVLRDSQGKAVTISKVEIEDEAEGKSLMPQGLTKFLTHDEVIDLIKFVSELGKPGPYEIRKTPCIQRWRLLQKPPKELTESVPHLEHIRELVLGASADQWIAAYGKVSGQLPLKELISAETNKVLYLQGELQVNEAGAIAFKLTSSENCQVWLDDQPVTDPRQFTSTVAAGRHTLTVRVELGATVEPYLQVEIEKPADSSAQFEVVGGP